MSEMAERVARALIKIEYEAEDAIHWDYDSLEDAIDANLDDFLPKAEAAIAAMREPTEAMKETVGRRNDSSVTRAVLTYQEWIDEALK